MLLLLLCSLLLLKQESFDLFFVVNGASGSNHSAKPDVFRGINVSTRARCSKEKAQF